jgi:hypothetical protein
MAYVSVSRGRYDTQIYTNNAKTLGQELSPTCPIPLRFSRSQERTRENHKPRTHDQISQGFGLGL